MGRGAGSLCPLPACHGSPRVKLWVAVEKGFVGFSHPEQPGGLDLRPCGPCLLSPFGEFSSADGCSDVASPSSSEELQESKEASFSLLLEPKGWKLHCPLGGGSPKRGWGLLAEDKGRISLSLFNPTEEKHHPPPPRLLAQRGKCWLRGERSLPQYSRCLLLIRLGGH